MTDCSIYDRVRFPIGIQTFFRRFSEMRMENYLYIDKAEYVYWMAHTSGKY